MGDDEELAAGEEGDEGDDEGFEGEEKEVSDVKAKPAAPPAVSREETIAKVIEGDSAAGEAKGQQGLGKLEPKRVIEAALFISSKPLTLEGMGKFVGVAAPGFVEGLVKELAAEYDVSGSSIKIVSEPGGWIMRLRSEYSSKVASLAQEAEVTKGALRILAYISQNEGIEQSKVADRLGSTVYDRVHELVDKGFVSKEKKGRTSVLKTTQKFRDYFGS